MKKANQPSLQKNQIPDLDLDTEDPGDDVQRRFFYQNSYAAIVCCSLLQPFKIKEIYCEHHEDILVKFDDNKFEGIQVKTRALHLPAFSFSDDTIQKALTRFVRLNLKYPGKFKSFRFVTNTSCQKKTSEDFHTVVAMAKEQQKQDLLANRSKTKKCINQIAKNLKCTQDDVIATLALVTIREEFSNLNDNKKHLSEELNKIPSLASQTLGNLRAIGEAMISSCHAASAKANEELSECYLLGKNVKEATKAAIIDGKRFTKAKVQKLINEIANSPLTHFLKDESSLNFKMSGTKKLEIKMDAGGIDNSNINLLKDLKYSFEVFSTSWLHKYESKVAAERYNQLQLIIQSESQEAFDESLLVDKLFGNAMLMNLRKRLRDRYNKDRAIFLDCDYEHLMGLAAVLTEDCKVWWSKRFTIETL